MSTHVMVYSLVKMNRLFVNSTKLPMAAFTFIFLYSMRLVNFAVIKAASGAEGERNKLQLYSPRNASSR